MPEWLLLVALIGLTAAAAWLLVRFARVVAIGSAYKAKVLCSIVYGSGRAVDPRRAEEVTADSYRVARLLMARVDPEARSVTVSFLGLRPRVATYHPGLGATLAGPQSAVGSRQWAGFRRATSAGFGSGADTAWPARPASAALAEVVGKAFSEPDPSRLRRTRAVLIVHDGHIIAERYAEGFSADTRCPGWSMCKSVMSALIGILVCEGRLAIDDRELLPEWSPPDERAAIDVEDLLRMRSGLRFSELYEDLTSDVIEMLFNQPDAAAYAASRPLVSSPGTVWSYSSGTTNILSRVARRMVGETAYHSWPRRALFDPIGMTSAIMEADASGTFVASSFMLATARDWARFGQLYLQNGVWEGRRMLPEWWVRFSTTPTPQSPGGIYGAHWWLKLKPEIGGDAPAASRIPPDAYFAVGHEGQTLTVIPSRRLVVVRLGVSIYIDAWNQAAFLADILDAL
jgi:CubicO group peptidase (beta-lactamase class C family)